MVLLRTDPFRDLDRWTDGFFRSGAATSLSTPMNAYRHGDVVTVELDLPGADPERIDVTVEKNELRIEAERAVPVQEDAQYFIRERTSGHTSRRLWIGDTLDADHLDAEYSNGVLVLRLPLREAAKPRKVEIRAGDSRPAVGAGS